MPAPTISRDADGVVSITSDVCGSDIRFSTDGSELTIDSPVYREPLDMFGGGTVKACLFHEGSTGDGTTVQFDLCNQGWQVVSATPLEPSGAILNNHPKRFWQSDAGLPQEVVIDMGQLREIAALTYLPRQDSDTDGVVQAYEWYLSDDGKSWGEPILAGEYDNIELTPCKQVTPFPAPATARFIKFRALRVVSGDCVAVNEIGVRG